MNKCFIFCKSFDNTVYGSSEKVGTSSIHILSCALSETHEWEGGWNSQGGISIVKMSVTKIELETSFASSQIRYTVDSNRILNYNI